MSPAPLRQIFLSCVTDEFAQHRAELKADLSLPGVKVQVQEDFVQGGGSCCKRSTPTSATMVMP